MKLKRLLTASISIVTAGLLGSVAPVLAAGNSIYLSLSSVSVAQGDTFSVSVRTSTSTGINGVQANLSYPTGQLLCEGISYDGSAFGVQAESSCSGGSIRIGRGAFSNVSGDQLVAIISFKAAVSSGSATVSVLSSSALASDGSQVAAGLGSATVSFKGQPAPAALSDPKQTTNKATTTTTNTPAAPPPDTTPPVISNVTAQSASVGSVVVAWTTDEASNSYVEYGINSQYGLSASDGSMVTSHKITLNSAFLLPNMQFHYRVTSSDAAGNKRVGDDQTFTTAGVAYTVTVLDSQGKPLTRAAVSLNGQTVYTDKNGHATLTSSGGRQTVTVVYDGNTQSKTVTINADKTQQADTFKLAASHHTADANYLLYPALVVLGLIIGVFCQRRLRNYLLAVLRGKNALVTASVSYVQKNLGDADPAHNPYKPRHAWSFWSIKQAVQKRLHRSAAKPPKEQV